MAWILVAMYVENISDCLISDKFFMFRSTTKKIYISGVLSFRNMHSDCGTPLLLWKGALFPRDRAEDQNRNVDLFAFARICLYSELIESITCLLTSSSPANNYNGRAYVAAAGTEWPRNLSLAQRGKPKSLDTRSSGGSVAAKQGSHLKQVTNDYWEIGIFNNDWWDKWKSKKQCYSLTLFEILTWSCMMTTVVGV